MTGRTIPVTRTDGSEVASEATLENIKAKTDNLDIALSVLRDALRGTSNKTNTDIVTALGQVVLAAGTATIGKVDQGAAGASPWAQKAADGDIATIGAKADASATDSTSSWSLTALSKGILAVAQAMQIWWANRLGTKTAANSLSVTGASDTVFYVGGASADGVAPTNQAVRVSGVDGSGLKRTLATDSSGYQYAKQLPRVSDTISLTTATSFKSLAVQDGYNSWWILLDGNFSGNVSFQYSPDNQANWYAMSAVNRSTLTGVTSTSSATSGNAWDGPIPQGATHIRIYVNTANSGTLTGTINISPQPYSATPGVTLATGTSRTGSITGSKIRYADTTSALTTASPSFTGTARDAWGASAGSASTSATEYAKLVTAVAFADQPFDLYIEVSDDNSTYNRWHKVSATAVGSVYGAVLQISPTMRYWRIYAVKTGSDTTYFRCNSKMEAA